MPKQDYIPSSTRAAFLLVLTLILNISRECSAEAFDSYLNESISSFIAGNDAADGQWVRPENCQRESHEPQNQLTTLRLPAANEIPIFLIVPAGFDRSRWGSSEQELVSLSAPLILRI